MLLQLYHSNYQIKDVLIWNDDISTFLYASRAFTFICHTAVITTCVYAVFSCDAYVNPNERVNDWTFNLPEDTVSPNQVNQLRSIHLNVIQYSHVHTNGFIDLYVCIEKDMRDFNRL